MEREKSYEIWGVLAAVILGLVLRLIPARNALAGGEIAFYSCDSFYHLRRIFYTVENFPSTLWFDSYLNHPHGFGLTWPPLFDQILAAFSLLLGGSPRAIEVTGAVIPPILGSLMIIVLYLLAKELFGMKVALLSAFLLAIDSKHISRTHFGLPDHDPLELLLVVGAILLIAYALTETERGRSLWFGAAAGALLAAAAYTWLGTPIYMIAILIYAAVQVALDLRKEVGVEATVGPLAAAFGVALLAMLPFWNEPWLSPSFFGAIGSLSALAFFYVISRLFIAKKVPWQAFVPLIGILCYIAFIVSYATEAGRGARSLLMGGLDYFFGSDLARVGVQLLFTIWSGLAAALMVAQARFMFLFSIVGSVLIALLFFWGADRIRYSDRSEAVDPRAIKAVIGLFLLILLLPAISSLSTIAQYEPEIAGDWHESLDWLSDNTPPTEGYEKPVQAGEYGVLSWWDYGNWILYQSRRPVVANNFQAGAEDAARFFLSETEEEAEAIAEERNVRYVMTDEKMVYMKLPAIARWIDEDPASYVSIAPDSDLVTYEHSPRFMRTVLSRLHLLDCTDLGHFRLIRESKTSSGVRFPVSEVKVFERVAGAKITGTTPYDEPMGVVLEMTSNQGRSFQYFNSVMPEDGRYEITVPYSTEDEYGTHSVGPYLLGPLKDEAGGDAREIAVSEEDVLKGRTIVVNF
ncbi:MAG: Oligosaccharyl transferase, STT3 subunit [Methanothrix harundinacea]|uniref:dolichyl-phosphooligosaccharide-protein glycotransferase n=1 Tax=Methanothrix harundinacea TaxID=301375 RepID=A0A101IGE9_9EURY|nr:MAG: Oligosaccharyl transferase, STT3 subunit [Methanothrix harundinacea]